MKINVDIQTLRSFLKISELGGISKAADALRLTQPAISQQIKRFEELLNVELLFRDGRTIRLTPAGEKLRAYAEKIVALNDELATEVGQHEKHEVVQLGMPEHFSEFVLPRIIGDFRDHFSGVHLVIKVGRSQSNAEQIETGRIDLALLLERIGSRRNKDSSPLPVRWYAGSRQPITANDAVPLVLFKAPCGFRRAAIETLESNEIKWRCVYECEDLPSLKAAVVANMGVTVLPSVQTYRGLVGLEDGAILPSLPEFEVRLRHRDGWSPAYLLQMETRIIDIWSEFVENSERFALDNIAAEL
ncbi:LysR substrate-binding domain-containing protein [Telmatospirillum sp.]|uniref:LysR substrate-binding domain-containing protein n=1 Tax=Telmatospirillum sp. TaxID=2079197 RepID=UPI0028415E00|nr:LysR substrate-binding domain-containing protein [Telmatospirillum sp.]MDR3440738.1 LysR substrate-binding domain-containing protein [Telmatospirillum sp.]